MKKKKKKKKRKKEKKNGGSVLERREITVVNTAILCRSSYSYTLCVTSWTTKLACAAAGSVHYVIR